MAFLDFLLSLLSWRSFANIWYWVAIFVFWARVNAAPLGVPYGLIRRAAREDAAALVDVEALLRVKINAIAYLIDRRGMWIVGGVFFAGTLIFVLGWIYRIEFARALALLFVPAVMVGALNVSRARAIYFMEAPQGPEILAQLQRHRSLCRFLGFAFVLLTVFVALRDLLAARLF